MQNRNLEHWFLDTQGKLLAWREWREQLATMDAESAYQEAALWWKFVPLINKTFDTWRTETWPTPWELVSRGEFCTSGQGLGMFYSLTLCKFECTLMHSIVNKEQRPRLLVLLPGNKLLNFCDGEVVDTDTADIQQLHIWQAADLDKLIKV